MQKIEIKPSDKVLFTTSYLVRDEYKEHYKENPDYLKWVFNNKLAEPLANNIIDKQVIIETSMPEIKSTEFRIAFYLFTPEEMKQFIQEVEETVLKFAGKRCFCAIDEPKTCKK